MVFNRLNYIYQIFKIHILYRLILDIFYKIINYDYKYNLYIIQWRKTLW